MCSDFKHGLLSAIREGIDQKTSVTRVQGVTEVSDYTFRRSKYRNKINDITPVTPGYTSKTQVWKTSLFEGVSSGVTSVSPDGDADQSDLAERIAFCADCIPAPFLDGWARLNCQRPATVTEAIWHQALDDGGRFLDAWGTLAAELGWSPGDLFDVPSAGKLGGLIWQLRGTTLEALGPDHARLSNGQICEREIYRG